ncbi:MAG: UvrD-helicase domain-containing protein [Saprospiraceae bacterium]
MNGIEKILENLNDQQRKAVTETEGFVRVIAGAGSGKTKALTSRYAYIVEALGINSSNILCVTFTNKAAQEMKKRVKRLLGENTDLSYITTYHGFCVRVLREEINKIQYPKSFLILDVEDQKTILREVFNELGLSSKDLTFKQVLRFISLEKSKLNYLSYILESRKVESDNDLIKVFLRYLEKQQRNFALDFDDLLNYTLYIFEKNDDVVEKWQKRLHYIQVDETQDSSERQFLLIEMLAKYHNNLFVVGDPDQTIYEWRGAKPEILVHFDKIFPTSQTILMNQNYRSTPNILNLGNHIIKNNKIRVDKDMFTLNNEGVEVIHFHAKNDFEEGKWVAQEIKKNTLENQDKYSDFAILYRANYISRIIEQSLIKENIPYSVYGGIRFFERKEIKDVISYLRLIVSGDDFSFLRVINMPARGLGKKFLENLTTLAEKQNKTLHETLVNNINDKEFAKKGAIEFLQLIDKFKKRKNEINVSDLVKEILDEADLTSYFMADGDTDRLENIKELQNSIIFLENEDGEKLSLENYLQEISLYTDMDIEDGKNDKVKLMTIHTSKGLEFPYVFLCGFTDGVLPSAMSIKERRTRALEEERRLTYVAITRAEKAFYMTESEGYNFTTGMKKYPSRFLFEISENFFIRKGELSKEIIEEAKDHIYKETEKLNILEQIFELDDMVNHKIFGDGKIIEVNEAKGEYQVFFQEKNLTKPIIFEFKGLTKISASEKISLYIKRDEEIEESNYNELVKEDTIEPEDLIEDQVKINLPLIVDLPHIPEVENSNVAPESLNNDHANQEIEESNYNELVTEDASFTEEIVEDIIKKNVPILVDVPTVSEVEMSNVAPESLNNDHANQEIEGSNYNELVKEDAILYEDIIEDMIKKNVSILVDLPALTEVEINNVAPESLNNDNVNQEIEEEKRNDSSTDKSSNNSFLTKLKNIFIR